MMMLMASLCRRCRRFFFAVVDKDAERFFSYVFVVFILYDTVMKRGEKGNTDGVQYTSMRGEEGIEMPYNILQRIHSVVIKLQILIVSTREISRRQSFSSLSLV